MKKTVRTIMLAGSFLVLLCVSIGSLIINSAFWPVALVAALLALGILIVLLRQHKKLSVPVATIPDPSEEAATAVVSLLHKQDELIDEWKNTMETRDKLKILKISSNSSEN